MRSGPRRGCRRCPARRGSNEPTARFFIDAYCDRLGFGVEVHGTPHMAVEQWDADLLRANEIIAAGRRLLVFSSYAIRHAPAEVMAQIQDLARTCGASPATNLVTIRSLPQHKRHQIR